MPCLNEFDLSRYALASCAGYGAVKIVAPDPWTAYYNSHANVFGIFNSDDF